MKYVKSYKELKKVVRKYWKKNAKKSVFYYEGKKRVSYWTTDVWCIFIIDYIKDEYKDAFKYDIEYDDIDKFIEKTNKLIGKHVKFKDKEGVLESIALANNGAYYVINIDGVSALYGLFQLEEV